MLKADNSLLLMIDFQDKLVNVTAAKQETENAKKMIKAANILNIPVTVSEQYPKGIGKTLSDISDILKDDVIIMEKTAFSLLKEDNAIDIIKSFNKKQIILFGIETHICVLQTAKDLINNGFEVFLIENACKSRQKYEHQAGLNIMHDLGVKIITLEIALFELLETSKHPHFKEIQALIK